MSLRLTLLNLFLRTMVKPRLRRLSDPLKARHDLERAAHWFFRATPLSLTLPVTLATGIPALWVINRPSRLSQSQPQPVILYLHGGGYVAGSPRTHAKMLARLSRLTGMKVLAPAYRLAPEHPFPAGFEDANAAFKALLQQGYRPGDIILGGDSAGGGLALALMAELCAEGFRPRALFAFSPLTDMRFTGASFSENARHDPLLPPGGKTCITEMYLAGHSAEDPRASPLLAHFHTPPPVFLQYGESEILRDDSRNMAAHLTAAGGRVVLDEWDGPPHVWVLFDGLIPEAREALRRVAAFLASLE